MRLETNQETTQKRRQMVQESFNRHLEAIVDEDRDITDFQVEVSTRPAMFHNEHAMMYMPEKRTFTYEGYTQSGKRFSLTIDE